MTTDEPLSTEAILDALATADRVLPTDALHQAAARWAEVGPVLIDLLENAARDRTWSDRTTSILFFGIYLMAQLSDTRAYRPLCAIAADGDRMSELIDDGVTEDLSIILARTYDGDPAPLRAVIGTPSSDQFVRDAAMGALAWLTASGRLAREETAAYLRHLYGTLQHQDQSYVWVGWQRAISALGLTELAPLVEDAFRIGWISDEFLSVEDFREDLAKAIQAADPKGAFDSYERDDGRLDDVATYLSSWAAFQPEVEKKERRWTRPTPVLADTPVRNPYRNVGRNDPCPCGSGKKFKKCCLGRVEAALPFA